MAWLPVGALPGMAPALGRLLPEVPEDPEDSGPLPEVANWLPASPGAPGYRGGGLDREKLEGVGLLRWGGAGALRHAWMRSLPLECLINGRSLGVANVYTCPVSEATSKRTSVPVSVLSSNAFFMIPALRLLNVICRRFRSVMN